MRIRTLGRHVVWVLCLLCAAVTAGEAETQDARVLARLNQTRDAFMARAAEEGYRVCPAPGIALGDPPAFGRFDPGSNSIVVATWSRLSPERRQRFENLAAGLGGGGAEALFRDGTYGWALVHELGHWWQGCRDLTRPRSYGAEVGANRIALAFWRERDPRYAARILDTFRYLRSAIPSPVPAGEPKQGYLEHHFLAMARSPGYTWYQADMIRELADEAPRPSFHKALSQPLYPW